MIYAVINFLVVCQAADMPEMMNDMPEQMGDSCTKWSEWTEAQGGSDGSVRECLEGQDKGMKQAKGNPFPQLIKRKDDMPEQMETKSVDMNKVANTAEKMINEDENDMPENMEMINEDEKAAAKVLPVDHESIIDTQDLDTFEELDNTLYAEDEYSRFFQVEADAPGPCYVHDPTGEMSEKDYRDMYVKTIKSRFEPGHCVHDCATPENEAEICYGFRDNLKGMCEIYLKPASTFQVSKIENSEFAGVMCSIKGVNCGGHFAINCEHCPPQDNTEPETHCNGHCFYDYKVDHVTKQVTGTCVGKMADVPTVDCGAHQALNCDACPTRYTFVCHHKERYCHGECEEHGCGINCESEVEAPESPIMIDEPMPLTEESVEQSVRGIAGDGFEGTSFDAAVGDLFR